MSAGRRSSGAFSDGLGSPRHGSSPGSNQSPTSRIFPGSPHGSDPASQPSHHSPLSPTAVNKAMQDLTIGGSAVNLSKRSPPGTNGKPLKALTNHFQVNVSNLTDKIFMWNAHIQRQGKADESAIGRVRRRVLTLLVGMPNAFTDGLFTDYEQMVVSMVPLTDGPGASKTFVVDYFDFEEPGPRSGSQKLLYNVTLTLKSDPLPTEPLKQMLNNTNVIIHRAQEYETALNIILLRFASQHKNLTTAARGTKVFPLTGSDTRKDLTGKLWAYRGYTRRMKLLQGGLYLCANVTAGVMYEETWADTLVSGWSPPWTPTDQMSELRMLQQFLLRLRVQGRFGSGRVKPIRAVANMSGRILTADEVFFFCQQNPRTGENVSRQVSVAWFFNESYPDVKRRNVKAPVLDMSSGRASPSSPVWWPADLCFVLPGQSYKRLLPFPAQQQAMIGFACRKPAENAALIRGEGLRMLGITAQTPESSIGVVHGSKIQVRMNMTTVSARRIQPPSLNFLKNVLTATDVAKGGFNVSNRQLRTSCGKASWTCLAFRKRDEGKISNLDPFISTIETQIAKLCNLPASQAKRADTTNLPPQDHIWPDPEKGSTQETPESYLKRLFQAFKSKGVQYLFIATTNRKFYSTIKKASDAVGIQTTVKLTGKNNMMDSSPQLVANLILKYNAKLGATNWDFKINDLKIGDGKTTMFTGMDVVHPPPGAMALAPSVAAMVASTKPIPSQFPGILNLQQHPDSAKQAVEMILQTDKMLISRLKLWQRLNGNLPQQLVHFRDGVSDGQFEQVLAQELPLIHAACSIVYKEANKALPKHLVIVVQKRHSARFYQPNGDKSGAFDHNGNPLPGLVVDQNIVSKQVDDFYLTSHRTLQGTSVPAHCIKIYDEIGLSADNVQQLTFALATIFPRSTTSIGIPAPVRLADRLCDRAKCLLHEVYFPAEEDQTYNFNGPYFKGQQDIHPDLRDTMFYI